MLRAGVAVTTITPPLAMPMAGFFTYREAQGVGDELMARALVLETGSQTVALVTCDLIRISALVVSAARTVIAARCAIPAACVMIAATHTHTGPITLSGTGDPGERPFIEDQRPPAYPGVTRGEDGLLHTNADPAYLDWVAGRIADAVAIAQSRLTPARLAMGVSSVGGICFNRRFRMRDGTVVFNPGVGNPDIVTPAGPVDPSVTALLVENDEGRPLALWANLSLHYVGTDDSLAFSADYFGAFARAVQRFLGNTCIGILANGASGDINNIDVTARHPVTSGEQSERVATAVAAAAVKACLVAPRRVDVSLAAESVRMPVERVTITKRDVERASAILARPRENPLPGDFSFVTGQAIPDYQVRTYAAEVVALAGLPERGETELQVIRIGDLALVALPGEIFVEIGLAIKNRSPFPVTAVVGLANDHIGYVPTRRAFGEGGYETWRTRISWSAPGTGEAMAETAGSRLNELSRRHASVLVG